MGLIKEPKDVDFFVVNKKLTKKERKEMVDFIEEYKRKQKSKKGKHKKAA
jgi:hypothetical protein